MSDSDANPMNGDVSCQIQEVDSVFDAVGLRPGSQDRTEEDERDVLAQGPHAPNPRGELEIRSLKIDKKRFKLSREPKGSRLVFAVPNNAGIDRRAHADQIAVHNS